MSRTLLNIERHFGANFSGLQGSVKIVVPDDVARYDSELAEAGITVKPGKQVYHLEIDPRSGDNEEELRQGVQGDHHLQSVGFTLRCNRQELVELRERCMNTRVHVIFTDNNCRTYLYLNQRLRRAKSGSQAANTRLRFSGSSVAPASFVHGRLLPPVTDIPIGTGDGEFPNTPDNGGLGNGTPGGGADEDLGGGDPGGGDPGGGGGDPGGGDPGVDVGRILQPDTGDYFRLTVTPCLGLELTKIS